MISFRATKETLEEQVLQVRLALVSQVYL